MPEEDPRMRVGTTCIVLEKAKWSSGVGVVGSDGF